MIYLFEDRIGRMNQYLKENINSNDFKIALVDCEKKDLFNYLNTNFYDANAILFHSSYTFKDDNITNEDVKKYFSDKKIPFIYFSGGLNNNIFIENGIVNGNVNSGDMYNNLLIFIEEFKTKSKINVPLLVHGEKYLLNSLLELQSIVSLYLFNKQCDFLLASNDYNEIIDLVEARIKEDELKNDKSKLLDFLNKQLTKLDKQLTKVDKQTLLLQIQKMINKY